ncbi:EamA family transporter [Marinomonas epiphytica]
MTTTSSSFRLVVSITALLIAIVSITAGAALAKSMFSVFTPEDVTVLRLSVSAVLLFILLKAWRVRPTRKSLSTVFAYGLAVAGMNLFFYLSIKTVPVGVALAVELIGPLSVAAFYSQKRSDYLWVLLAATGIFLLLPKSAQVESLDVTGLCYALVAAFFWGAYIVMGKKAGEHFGSKAPSLGLICASLMVMPVGNSDSISQILDMNLFLFVVVIAMLSSAIPLMLEMFALRNLPTNVYGVMASGEPVMGAIVSFFILGEQLSVQQCLGVGAIVVASMGIVLSPFATKPALQHEAKAKG